MLAFLRMFANFIVGVYDSVNVSLFEGVGFMDIVIGFLVIALITTAFWKGVRI